MKLRKAERGEGEEIADVRPHPAPLSNGGRDRGATGSISRRFWHFLPHSLGLLADVLAGVLILLGGVSVARWVDWRELGGLAGPPWDALLNPDLGPRMALLMAGLAIGYLCLRVTCIFLGLAPVQNVLGNGTIVAFRRLVTFAAWLPLVTSGCLLPRIDPATLRAVLDVHGTPISLTLPTLAAMFIFSLAAVTLPPHAPKRYLPRPLDRLAGLVVFPMALAIALTLHQTVRGPQLFPNMAIQVAATQAALLAVELACLLAVAEAFLADVADFRRMRAQGVVRGALGLCRAGIRLVISFGPVVAGLWLAIGASLPAASLLLDREGRLLRLYYPNGVYRIPVSSTEMPDSIRMAIDAIEDPGVYTSPLTHSPINPIRMGGVFTAATRTLYGEQELSGGSGMATQICKNFFGRPLPGLVAAAFPSGMPLRGSLVAAATVAEKLLFEFPCGWAYERSSLWLGPDRSVTSFYLNSVYFGQGAFGVQAASLTYFGKPARELTAVEGALLAGLPQAPSALGPWQRPDAVKARRGDVVSAMVREGYLSPEEAAAINAAPLGVLPEPNYPRNRAERLDSFVRYLMRWLDGHGYRDLSTGGYRVAISLDPVRQRDLEGVMTATIGRLAARRVNNGGAVALDPRDGEILAWFGGLQLGGADALPDMVDGLPHQPGSAIKPLLYACALEEGQLQPDERLDDTPRVIGGRYVTNWDLDPVGRGMRPAAEALSGSRNTAAAELVNRLTPEGFASCLRDRFRVRAELHPETEGVELGLGLAEMPMLEVAGAFTVLANGGVYVEPTPVRSIHDRYGCELYLAGRASGPKLLSDGSARWVSQAMVTVSRNLGIPGEVATKTGTTPSSSFVVGYRQGLLLVAWLGRAEPGRGRLDIDDVEGQDAAWAVWRAQAAIP